MKVNGVAYTEHRIAYMYEWGWCPEEIDHIDHNPLNNDVRNLRPVSNRDNCRRVARAPEEFYNVRKRCQRWSTRTKFGGKQYHLGTYDTPEEAAQTVADFLTSKGVPTTIEDLRCRLPVRPPVGSV